LRNIPKSQKRKWEKIQYCHLHPLKPEKTQPSLANPDSHSSFKSEKFKSNKKVSGKKKEVKPLEQCSYKQIYTNKIMVKGHTSALALSEISDSSSPTSQGRET
jgi:hypothetical protein